MIFLLIAAILLLTPLNAYAYIDPGSGGYFFGSILPALMGFVALVFAYILHFFRFTLKHIFMRLWTKHRWFVLIVLVGGLIGGGYFLSRYFSEPHNHFDPSLSGVQVYKTDKVFRGYNLFEGKLMDMQGNIVKKWDSIYLGVIDQNGDYYAQQYYEASKWGRYRWDGTVVWEKNFPIHHEIILTPSDTVITFSKEVKHYHGRKVEFDVILEFDKEGRLLTRFSLWDHKEEFQQFHRKLELDMPKMIPVKEDSFKENSIWGGNYDYYHLNALSIIPENARQGTHPAFRPGNWLISFRHGGMLFILDQDTKNILWRAIDDQISDGRLEGPHAPFMLPSGNIIVFDNGRYRKWSRIIELDPVNLKVVWEYRADQFYTLSQGYVEKLKNGNFLITESEKGRVFELTEDKEIVWEYYHPEQQDATNSTSKEKYGLRQEIYRMSRYSKDFIDPFLNRS